MNPNFCHLILTALHRNPEQIAVVWPAGMGAANAVSATAKELLEQITAAGHHLRKNGIGTGEKVMLLLPVGPELICNLLAVMATGAVPVLPPAGISKAGLFRLLRAEGISKVIIKDAGLLHKLLGQLFGVKLLPARSEKNTETKPLLPEPVNPEQPALISHSSGSTGKPKAIRRSHRVLRAQHETLKRIFPPVAGQVDFPLFPNILLHNLAASVTTVFPGIPGFDLARMEPARIIEQLQANNITTLTGNVFYFKKLLGYLQQNPVRFMQVSALGIGGSPVPENVAFALNNYFPEAAIYLIYGSSEAEPIAVRKLENAPSDPRLGYAAGPAVSELEIKINPIGKIDLPDGKSYRAGEIQVRGKHAATPENGWLRTGDFGYLNGKGQLFLTGRQGNETMHYGVQHYQIEHTLQHLSGVEQAAAKARPDGFEIYVTGACSETDIRDCLAAQFPAAIIKGIIFREKLPVDARHHSKILYPNLS